MAPLGEKLAWLVVLGLAGVMGALAVFSALNELAFGMIFSGLLGLLILRLALPESQVVGRPLLRRVRGALLGLFIASAGVGVYLLLRTVERPWVQVADTADLSDPIVALRAPGRLAVLPVESHVLREIQDGRATTIDFPGGRTWELGLDETEHALWAAPERESTI